MAQQMSSTYTHWMCCKETCKNINARNKFSCEICRHGWCDACSVTFVHLEDVDGKRIKDLKVLRDGKAVNEALPKYECQETGRESG
ncbi:hypothetical protein VTL71DRAFT_859 [Oculimacula yallundae]|uniref:RanBP2-type domain-containing protein n=1 Tax=Oculimacula yallundae TaxID=86028 RepID=A0ABR4D3I5_9HELO